MQTQTHAANMRTQMDTDVRRRKQMNADASRRAHTYADECKANGIQCVGGHNLKTRPDVRRLFKDFRDVLYTIYHSFSMFGCLATYYDLLYMDVVCKANINIHTSGLVYRSSIESPPFQKDTCDSVVYHNEKQINSVNEY